MMVQDQEEMDEGSEMPTDPHHTPTIIPPSTSQPQKKQRSRRLKREDNEIPQSSVPSDNVADEAVNEEMDGSLERATTTATGLDAEQDRVPSDESSLGDQEDASKQGRKIDDIDKDAEITLVDETQGRYGDDIMFDVSDLAGEEVFIAEQGVPNTMKRVNTFVDYRTELVEGSSKKANVEIAQDSSSKRARDELEQEIKWNEDKETAEHYKSDGSHSDKREEAVDANPLYKPPSNCRLKDATNKERKA
ncbi:hypothetical protein Tco_1397985 [Tanacetum coccineum]